MRLRILDYCRGVALLFLLILSANAFGQALGPKVVCAASGSSSGNASSGQSICANWTMGEPIVQTIWGTTLVMTQGFHQYDEKAPCNIIISTQPLVSEAPPEIQVYPNPTANEITVQYDLHMQSKLLLVISDLRGKELYSKVLVTDRVNERISLSRFAAGEYFLGVILKDGSSMRSVRITKISQ